MWKELGYKELDYNSGSQVGVARLQYTIKNGTRQSANTAFIRPIRRKRSNLTIKTNSQVIKVIIDEKSKTAIGVEYVTGENKVVHRSFASKEVIISAGAIDSPKILMLSGIGPADELEKAGINLVKDLAVGKNFQEHVAASIVTLRLKNESESFEPIETKLQDIDLWFHTRDSRLNVPGIMSPVQFIQTSFDSRPGVPDIQNHYMAFINDTRKTGVNSLYRIFSYYNMLVIETTLITPKSRGWIELNKSDPIWSKPLIYPNFYDHPEDLQKLVEGLNITSRLMHTQTLKTSNFEAVRTPAPNCDKFLSNMTKYYECIAKKYLLPLYHPVGTCKMGPKTDPNAVVDERLRVYGIQRLRVIDASIMPSIIRGNTNAPSMMIGEKGSDMIKEDYKFG